MVNKTSSFPVSGALPFFAVFLALGLLLAAPVVSGQTSGNSIGGHVFGVDRRPLRDIHVELLDDLSRTLTRTRTDSSGRYTFFGLSSGRFKVRVMPLGTDYEEQEQEVEIVTFTRTIGEPRVLGVSREQKDFYLRPRRGTGLDSALGAVFVQEVPGPAKKLYDAALEDLEHKRTKEAYASLKAALEIFPNYFDALERLGTEYVKAGHYDAAEVLLTLALKVNPRAFRSHHGLALAMYARQRYPEALTSVEKAIEIYAFAPESLLLSGALLRQARRYPEAEKRLLKANELGGGLVPDVHWELALLYGNGLARYKEAAKELKLYLKARPDHKDTENIRKLIAEFEEKAKSG
jgi:hypothetical protein